MIVTDFSPYKNFKREEFTCKHTGLDGMQKEFLDKLQHLRSEWGKPIYISSGYRHETHPLEVKKSVAGWHSKGLACDIAISGGEALKLVVMAVAYGFNGVGIQQKGGVRFIHLDLREAPALWSY